MPLLYGEGSSKAFFRLQREILETTHDQSILAVDSSPSGERSALASHPKQFTDSGVIDFKPLSACTIMEKENIYYDMTTELNRNGVSVELLVVSGDYNRVIYGILDFQMGKNPLGRLAIPLHPAWEFGTSPIVCRRGEGLFEISPDHLDYARDFRVLNGRSDLITCPDSKCIFFMRHYCKINIYVGRIQNYRFDIPPGSFQMQNVKRQKLLILHNSDHSGSRIYRDDIPFRIQCIGSSSGCAPYSVEAEIPGYAILRKPGYPRLLVHTFDTFRNSVWSSGIWILETIRFEHDFLPDDTKNAGQILAKLKQDYRIYDKVLMALGAENVKGLFTGWKSLNVRGSSTLKVEVSVRMVEFLDWSMPEVTVHTSEVNPLN